MARFIITLSIVLNEEGNIDSREIQFEARDISNENGPLVCRFGTFMVYTTIADSYDEVCSKLNFLKISERTSFFNFANLPKPEGKVYLFGSINQNEDGEPFFYNRYIGIAIPVFGLTKDCVIVEF